jgi:signal transduction histidine kinase
VACTLEVDPEFPGARYLEATDSKALSLDPEVALVLFRVLQEATTNALKHGQAQHITLALRMDAGHFVARVQDDGVGFDPAAATEGFGLLGLRERISAAGGALSIQSAPGATSIEARF